MALPGSTQEDTSPKLYSNIVGSVFPDSLLKVGATNTITENGQYSPEDFGDYWFIDQINVGVINKYKLSLFDFTLNNNTINKVLKNPNESLTIIPRDYILFRIEFPDPGNDNNVGFNIHWEYIFNGSGNTQFTSNNYAYYLYCTPNNITQYETIVLTYNSYYLVHCNINPNDETSNFSSGTIYFNNDKIIN